MVADEPVSNAPGTARGTVQRIDPTKAQRAAARRVAESKATIPHFYLEADVRASEADPAAAVHASALALREFPRLNGAYRDGAFETYSRINVGVALEGAEALVFPTIFDADRKDVAGIAAELEDLSRRVAGGQLTSPESAGGTFTVVIAAVGAIRSLTPVINQGQAGTLGIGPATERPLAAGGELVAGTALTAILACDARMVAAGEGARFLDRVRDSLEDRSSPGIE